MHVDARVNRVILNPMNTPIPTPPITDLPQYVQELIARFNARPARRVTDVRVQGWSLVEPETV